MEIRAVNFNLIDECIQVVVKESDGVIHTYILAYRAPKDIIQTMWIPIGKGMIDKLTPAEIRTMMRTGMFRDS